MRALNEAWHVLGNAESRRAYDVTLRPESNAPSRPNPTAANRVRVEVDDEVRWSGFSPLARLLAHYVKRLTFVVLGSLILALLFGLFADANGQGVEDSRLDRALRRGLEEAGTPGIAASFVFPDGRRWSGFAGEADTADGRPVKSTTPFAVASVTKTFVAALALQLAEEGRVSLDEPVARWLPELPAADAITLRQLLGHTSGLSDVPFEAESRRWTPADVIAEMSPPACTPGTCFRYADTNYVAAGAVLETATGTPVPQLVRRRFFTPLGMDHTWFQGAERARGRTATAYGEGGIAITDGSRNVPTTEFVSRTGLSGSVATTADDLATWGNALFRGDVLRPSSLEEMLDFEASAGLECPVGGRCGPGYGLGMGFDQLNAWPVWQHSGSTGALLTYFPRQRITVAVVTNGSPEFPPGPFPALRALADALPSLQTHTGVFAIDANGSNRHLVTRGGGSAPAVSPDGTRLAYAVQRSEGSDVAVADVDGRHVRLLTRDHEWNFRPAWSPDGQRIAFASERDGNPEIYVMRADGSEPVRLTDDPAFDGTPAWSPDGTLIAFSRHVEDRLDIRVMQPDGSDQRNVLSMTIHGRFTGVPSWSPDGTKLAFAGDVGGVPNIQIVDLDGSDLTAVTAGHAPSTEAAWAPDGTLVFGRLGRLYTVVPGEGQARKLDRSDNPIDYLPAWSRDSRTVLFTAQAPR